MDIPKDRVEGYSVRAWFFEHLYPEKPTGTLLNLELLEERWTICAKHGMTIKKRGLLREEKVEARFLE